MVEPKKYVKGKHQRTDWGHGVKEIRKMKETPAKPEAKQSLQVALDEETAQGKYANLASVGHGETEFVLDFMFMQPNQPKAKVHSRVISSPVHTKRFLAALADNVRKYEDRFGPIILREAKEAQA